MHNQVLQSFYAKLKESGKSEQEIAAIRDSLMQSAFALVFADAMAVFSEDDIIAIEQCEDNEATQKKVLELYILRTGKNPQEEIAKLLEKFTQEYLAGMADERAQ